MAKADFDKGEYQWVAEVTNTIVFADPTNTDARLLCADALDGCVTRVTAALTDAQCVYRGDSPLDAMVL